MTTNQEPNQEPKTIRVHAEFPFEWGSAPRQVITMGERRMRNRQVIAMKEDSDLTNEEIGRRVGLTGQRVGQIIAAKAKAEASK